MYRMQNLDRLLKHLVNIRIIFIIILNAFILNKILHKNSEQAFTK